MIIVALFSIFYWAEAVRSVFSTAVPLIARLTIENGINKALFGCTNYQYDHHYNNKWPVVDTVRSESIASPNPLYTHTHRGYKKSFRTIWISICSVRNRIHALVFFFIMIRSPPSPFCSISVCIRLQPLSSIIPYKFCIPPSKSYWMKNYYVVSVQLNSYQAEGFLNAKSSEQPNKRERTCTLATNTCVVSEWLNVKVRLE